MKNGKPAWPRWLMLVAALLLCWSIWDEAGVYAALTARPVFSPEETAAIAAGAWRPRCFSTSSPCGGGRRTAPGPGCGTVFSCRPAP